MKDFFQAIFAGVIGALAAYFNVLLISLIVLLVVMPIDYVTGMAYSGKPLLYDYLNKGQRKKIINTAEVKALFDRYGVEYEE